MASGFPFEILRHTACMNLIAPFFSTHPLRLLFFGLLFLSLLPGSVTAQVPSDRVGVANPAKTGSLPPDTATLGKRAAAAFSSRDWDAARAAYMEMLQVEPVNALVWANLGAVEQQAGRSNEAVEAFEQAVRLNPGLVQSWIALGLSYSERGDAYRAVSALSRAVHEDPTDARAHNYLAVATKNLGWTQAAQVEFEKAIALRPDYGVAHFNLALTYLDQRPPATELARRHYEQALKLGMEKDEIVERKLKESETP